MHHQSTPVYYQTQNTDQHEALKDVCRLDYRVATGRQSEFGCLDGSFNHRLNRGKHARLTRSPESIISVMKLQPSIKTEMWLMTRCSNSLSRNTILVIHDPPLDLGDISHVQPPSPFFFSLPWFFSHTDMYLFMCVAFLFLFFFKAVPISLTPQALTQYSADKDREGERLGRDVEGNDNARAEFIH